MSRRVMIFANGEIPDIRLAAGLLLEDDFLLAADGGLRHLAALGREPDALIGDMDSADPREVSRLEESGQRVERHPVDKDETDLELALDHALAEGADEIRILAALGGRLDQTLGNIFLLLRPDLSSLDVRLDDGSVEVFLIRGSARIAGKPGDIISLLPLNGPGQGVTTGGLKYPLDGETLYPQRTRGISNVMINSEANVSVHDGILLCVHSRSQVEDPSAA